jgi:CheY-like chemotaxis protein
MPRLNQRVLLVEDGLENQRLITLLLQRAGAEVVVAENGQVAIETIVAGGARSRSVGSVAWRILHSP